jgi:parallel beta-helix repeat protein
MQANGGGVGVGTKSGPARQCRWRWEACRGRWAHGLAALAAVLALLLGSGPAIATDVHTIPSTGLVIDQPGTYTVTQDLFHGDSGAAILITASNVILDLNGYTLYGNFVGVFIYGIVVHSAQAVTVRNGRITGFSNDIRLSSSSNSTIENITASSFGNWGIQLDGSHGNTVQNNTSSSNFDGVRLTNSNSNTIQNNTLSGNYPGWPTGRGITLGASSNNTIRNNTTNSNSIGILLFAGSSSNTIENNTANSNADAGIVLFSGPSGNTIRNNTALNNSFSFAGFFKADLHDSNLSTPCANTWTGNIFVSDNETGADYGPAGGCIRGLVPPNLAPIAHHQAMVADQCLPTPLTLTASDADGDPLNYTILTAPVGGTLSGSAPHLTYTSNPGFQGNDSFTFKVNDGKVDSNIATVTLTVVSPAERLQNLRSMVTAAPLNQGQVGGLVAKLDAALAQLEQNNKPVAIHQLEAFIQEVQALMMGSQLSQSEGQKLIEAAQKIIRQLNC